MSEHTRRQRRRAAISGQFVPHLVEMRESPAWRVLSASAKKLIERIELEHAHHGGTENGRLPVTYNDFVRHGIDRHAVHPALAEAVALGFVEVTERGRGGNAEFRRPNLFRLTFRAADNVLGDGSHEWRRIETVEDARRIRAEARQTAAERERRKRAKKQKSSGGKYQFSVGETPTGAIPISVGETPTTVPVGKPPLLSISRVGWAVGGRTAASLSGQTSREGVRVSAPDGSSMSPSPSPDAPSSSIPSPQSAASTVASINTASPARRARLPPDQLELFAAPPPPCPGTPRDRCIAVVVQWDVDPAMAAATVDRGIAAGGIGEVARLIGEANSTDGRRNHAHRWAWFRNRVAKFASRAEVERVTSSVGSASANDAGASAHNAVIEIGAWKIIVGQLVRWDLSAEAAGPFATSLIRTLGGSRQAVDYVQSVVRRRRSGKASVATIERCISSPNSKSRRRVRRDDHAKQPQSH
jgi:hypothetical protein